MSSSINGIIPVMITPFTPQDRIDWAGYEALIEWYIANGSEALFAVCQSSEMQYLSLEERVALARFTAEKVAGRVPVVASGHISDSFDAQKEELLAVADTGVDGVVLVTNRLAAPDAGSDALRSHLDALLAALPHDMPLGLYECPAPYRRLLTDEVFSYCAESGRFALLKDVSCDVETVKRRAKLAEGTPLEISNANSAISWPLMKSGQRGFCGVMLNIHPDLYRWMQDHGRDHVDLAEELAVFLTLSAVSEGLGYPKLAKIVHQRLGTFAHAGSRAVPYDVRERHWALDAIIDRLLQGSEDFRGRVAASA